MDQEQKKPKIIKKWIFILFLIPAVILSSCFSLRINEVNLRDSPEEKKLNEVKIIHLSDIHISNFTDSENIEDLIKAINDLQGDIIVYTGDYGSLEEMKQGYEIFPKLKCKYKKYAVLGNHDYGDKERAKDNWTSDENKVEKERQLKDLYNKWGVELLLNESDTLNCNNNLIAVIGLKVFDPHHGYFDSNLENAICNVRGIKNKVLLMHNPQYWREQVVGKYDISLSLAGHTHGGQIGIGLGDYKISPAQLMYSDWRGIYKEGDEILFVNTGIGTYGMPFRIGMDPEIVVVTLPLL